MRFDIRPATARVALMCLSLAGLDASALPAHSQPPRREIFPRVLPASTRIYDPRLAGTRVTFAQIKNRVVIEGDIDLGSVAEVRDSFVQHVARLAANAVQDPDCRV